MLQQLAKISSSSVTSQKLSKVITQNVMKTNMFKKDSGNSFSSFKEYRENAKTYGPLSASLASKRHLTDLHKFA